MARYFLDLFNGETAIDDPVGSEFPTLSAACEQAKVLAANVAAHLARPSQLYDPREFHVRAADGRRVAKIAFRYVVD